MTDDDFASALFVLGTITGLIVGVIVYHFVFALPLEEKLGQSNCAKIANRWICPNAEGKYILDGMEIIVNETN